MGEIERFDLWKHGDENRKEMIECRMQDRGWIQGSLNI